MTSGRNRGLTLVELMIGLSVVSVIALLVSTLTVRSFSLNRESRIGLQGQQDMAFALRHFSEDVRKANGLATSPEAKKFVLRQLHEGGYRYVTYRFSGGKLQRGISSALQVSPAAWTEVVDPEAFQVKQGDFRYFTLEGISSDSRDSVRRIDLTGLRVQPLGSAEIREIPTLSATMREEPQARVLEAPDEGIRASNASTKNPKVAFMIRNSSDAAVTIRHVELAWTPPSPRDVGTTLDFGGFKKQSPGKLPGDVILAAGSSRELEADFKFEQDFALPATLTVTMYGPAANGRGRPYVMIVDVLPKHER